MLKSLDFSLKVIRSQERPWSRIWGAGATGGLPGSGMGPEFTGMMQDTANILMRLLLQPSAHRELSQRLQWKVRALERKTWLHQTFGTEPKTDVDPDLSNWLLW